MAYYNHESNKNPHYSFKFFPTQSTQDERDFWRTVRNFEVFDPDFSLSLTAHEVAPVKKTSIWSMT